MRLAALALLFTLALAAPAADVESRALTHYVPQDLLEEIVRKGDIARIWAGGLIDRGGDQPGKVVAGPAGPDGKVTMMPDRLVLSKDPSHAFAILFKTEDGVARKCVQPGKPLEIPLVKEGAKLWIGFNDERGQFRDNHLGKGARHELDPAWVRIEVIRIVVD